MQASLPPKVHLQHHFSAYGHLGRVWGEGRWEAIDERQQTRGIWEIVQKYGNTYIVLKN